MGFDEALEHAIFMRRFLIHNKLTVSEKETKMDDSSSEFSENSDDENDDTEDDTQDENDDTEDVYDIWKAVNNKLDDENLSGMARRDRSLSLVLEHMKCGIA